MPDPFSICAPYLIAIQDQGRTSKGIGTQGNGKSCTLAT